MNKIIAIFISSLIFSLIACSQSEPSSKDANNYLGNLVQSESNGRITLNNFNKIDGLKRVEDDVEFYTLDFVASIEFLETCRWVTGHLAEFKGFKTKPIDQRSGQSGYSGYMAAFSNPGTNVEKGTKFKLQ